MFRSFDVTEYNDSLGKALPLSVGVPMYPVRLQGFCISGTVFDEISILNQLIGNYDSQFLHAWLN